VHGAAADYGTVVNPIQGQNPWLALQGATRPAAPATLVDPAQLLERAQTAAGDAAASLVAPDSGIADPSVAAAMAALQALTGPQQLPAVGADVLSSYLASNGGDTESSNGSDPGAGTDLYV
jgi:hypothetical protein